MEQLLATLKTSAAQTYAQLKDLYLSMTFGNRVVAALLMATLLFSLGYLVVGSIPKSDPMNKTVKIYGGYRFDLIQMRAAESALGKENLKEYQWIGDQLQVPKDKQHQYVAALAKADVTAPTITPKQNEADKLTPWQSRPIMTEKITAAAEKTCADTIKWLPGIADATVSSAKRPEWERNVWARKNVTSVSVSVVAIDNKPLPQETITAIGNIVAPAFGITNRKEIGIVDTRNSKSYDGLGEEVGSALGEYLRYQTRYQAEWERKIREHLPSIDGLDVSASVMLTTYREKKAFEIEHGKPTALTIHELDYAFKKEGYDRFFRPGQIAQWSRPLIDPTGNISPKDLVDEKKREAEVSHALQGVETTSEELPYIPRKIMASIRIPREHLVKLWKEQNRLFGSDPAAKPTPEELKAVEEALTLETKESVAILLTPYRESNKTDPKELVTVTYFDLPRPEEIVLTAWEQFILFLQENWKNLSLMSLVFCGMTVLYLISKPQKPDNIVIYEGLETPLEAIDARIAEKRRLEEERLAAEAAAAEATAAEQEAFENSLGGLGSIRSLRDEIAELIAKNPEAAAAVIRQWIGNAVLVEANS